MTNQPEQIVKEIRNGCGKEWCEENTDCTCGEDFPDDDGQPFCILCSECQAKLSGIILAYKNELEFLRFIHKDKTDTIKETNKMMKSLKRAISLGGGK